MKRYRIYIYWILMLVPTLMIGVGAIALLQREQNRLDEGREKQLLDVARQKANLFADRVRISLDVMQQQLISEVMKVEESEIPGGLEELERTNPLARNVFSWSPGGGVLFPVPRRPATREQRRFLMRYETLFNGAEPWMQASGQGQVVIDNRYASNVGENRMPGNTASSVPQTMPTSNWYGSSRQQTANQPAAQDSSQRQQQVISSRSGANDYNIDLQVLGEEQSQQAYMPNANLVLNSVKAHRQEWTPWFSGNQLHLLGWAQMAPGGPVRGVELEMMSFVSRLYAPAIGQPDRAQSDGVYCKLTDGGGRTLYQEGDPPSEKSKPIVVNIPIGPTLPHWTVYCSWTPPPSKPLGRSFLVVGGLLAGIFVLTILLGGSLLMWQARKDSKDAVQKTSFVSNVSHELKTPLTSIRMYAELLGERRVTDEAKKEKYLNVVVAESQRLSRLVNNVLDFSRLEQGRRKYSKETMKLSRVIDEALHHQLLRLQEAGLSVETQLCADEIEISTDRDALEQVFINLLDNACKYAGEGGELTVTSSFGDDFVEVTIMDRGPGISGEHRQKIFDQFHRVDNSLTRNQDGVGLGLSIARRLLTDQGGDLVYHDREGGGACFTIRLTRR